MLIIEDDVANAAFLKRGFEAESFAVDIAHDGERGSYSGRTNDYDIIITDNIMPKKSGLDVCRDIRASGKICPIIILSVKSEIPEKIELLNAGADDYMLKPYSFDELLARVWAKLRRTGNLETPLLQIGNLIIDVASQEVRLGNEIIYLTRKEFSLLELLAKNRGKVVSRGTIMEHVWDMEGDPLSRTIETHILNLRKKITSSRSGVSINTVPGRGYKMSEEKFTKN